MKKTLIALFALSGVAVGDIIKTNVTVELGKSADYGYLEIGSHNSQGSLTNHGVVNANQIYIYDGWLVNNGIMNDVPDEMDEECYDFLSLSDTATGGYIENNGTINGRLFIHEGRTLTLGEGSYTEAVEIWGGCLEIDGRVKTEYMYLDDNSEVIMTLGSSVDFMGGDFELYDVKLVLLVDSILADGDTTTDFRYLQKDDLFVNYVDATWGRDGFTSDTVITLRDAAGNETTRKYSELSAAVPEPATTTLSLLALCGLASRRRRK